VSGAEDLLRRLPGYAPELSASGAGAARAVMRVFARYMELLHDGLADVPDRALLAYLDMMGVHLLPAQAARVPLVFSLIDGSPADVTIPERSQVAAAVVPAPPSLLDVGSADLATDPVVFATDQAVTLTRSRLASLYSIVPGSDAFADHTGDVAAGFTLFDGLQPTEHAIYLGHDHLFALAGEIAVILAFSLGDAVTATSRVAAGRDEGVRLQWEYLTDSGWLPFENPPEEDTTGGLRIDGEITLRRACGPDAKKETLEGHTTYWLRGRLITPLLPLESSRAIRLPVVNDIRASVSFGKNNLLPETAFTGSVPVDVTKPFLPFGPRPATHDTFYVASKEVFQRKRARVSLDLQFSTVGQAPTSPALALMWEYHDGSSWRLLFKADEGAATFTAAGTITFICPPDWGETRVNGVQSYWLRARITAGDYGHPAGMAVTTTGGVASVAPTADTLHPPIVSRLSLAYAYVTDPELLDHCLTHNDFVFADRTDACRWPDQTFTPFQLVADRHATVHFGFDRPLPVGLLGLYVDVALASTDFADARSSPFVWEYRSARGWTELGVLDETLGFQRSGMVQFVGPADAVTAAGQHGSLYRIRARLKTGERARPLAIAGLWLNAVWATHSQIFEQEPLGTSDGNPRQTFSARRAPVMEGETIEVEEWTGRGEYWRTFVQDVADADLRFERDPGTGAATAVWVRWHGREHLHESAPVDRHYLIERARGLVVFGDGRHGMIPPAGRRVAISYRSGGGLIGNLPAGAVAELRTAVPFVLGATNPVAAAGGAGVESIDAVRARGPQRLRHRDRAVSPQDFEWMARDASSEVARARCLPVTGPDGRAQRGWVTVLIVPHSSDARPRPAVELRRRVRDYLAARVPAAIAGRLRVEEPRYVGVSVSADIVPAVAASAALVEARVRVRLDRFLHPLLGGTAGEGWDFGETVHISQIASVIEATDGVDFATAIGLAVEGRLAGGSIPIEPDMLVAPGDHELKLIVGVD